MFWFTGKQGACKICLFLVTAFSNLASYKEEGSALSQRAKNVAVREVILLTVSLPEEKD